MSPPLPHSLRVVIAPPAAFEIADAATAYEATRPGLGKVFLEEIRGVGIRIQEFPEGCPEVHAVSNGPSIRRALTHRFPYGVLYRVTAPPNEVIQILAVMPTRADPVRIAQRALAASQ